MEWFITITAVLGMIYCISVFINRSLAFTGAVGGAIIASYSLGGAIIVWPIGLVLLLMKKANRKYLLGWVGATLATIGMYYLNYHPTNSRGLTSTFLDKPNETLEYFLTLMGRSFTYNPENAQIIGAVSLLLLIPLALAVVAKRKYFDSFIPWIGIVMFSLLSLGVISIGRVGDGIYNATSSRYTTFTLLYFIGVTGLTFTLLSKVKFKKSAHAIGLIVVAVSLPLIISSYTIGIQAANIWRIHQKPLKECLHAKNVSDKCLRTVHYNQNVKEARKDLEFIKSKGWGGFNAAK